MVKKVLFGKESRDALLEGIKKITSAVKCTMGAAGKTVLIGEAVYGNDGLVFLPSKVTKDGWSVAKHFQLDDPIENRGAMLIKEAAAKTVEMVGDATTCTCILAEALIIEGVKLIDEGANSQEIKKGIDAAVEYVVEKLKEISTPVRGDIERVRQIATVSANNDKFIGDLIADAFSKIGFDGVIDIEKSNGTETQIKISEGLKFDRGWVSPLFVNNPSKEICEFQNPLILLYDKKINHHTQIQKILELSMSSGNPLLIICEDAEAEGLAFLAMNNYQKRVQVCVVKSPEFGDLKRDWMEDIAMLTGGYYISDIRGMDIKKVTLNNLGKAKKVVVSKTETIIIGGEGDKEGIEDLVNNLKMNLTQAETEDEKYLIEKRIARLTGGIAVIQVGGTTETELSERLDRVEDSVRATKAAISEGFVAGGGTAFLKCMLMGLMMDVEKIDGNIEDAKKIYEQTGVLLEGVKEMGVNNNLFINKILMQPLKQICENAGVEIVEEIIKKIQMQGGNMGYNVLTGKIEDMVEAGIIDSTKALRCALVNAASIAGAFLTSECSINVIH